MKQRYTLILRRILLLFLLAVIALSGFSQRKILVFSKTAGYRHGSISNGIDAIRKIGNDNGFTVVSSENAADFNTGNLEGYAAVVFMSTTGDILNNTQQTAFEKYIKSGGGFAGVHAATDTEYNWPWYGKLVGAWFNGHPDIQQAKLNVANSALPGNGALPASWTRTDEWYNFGNFQSPVTPLISIDETSYNGGTMGGNHPIAWFHEFDGGRAWYTAMGHTDESFTDDNFLTHLSGGILFAAGNAQANQAPVADAGADIVVNLPQNTAALKGKGTDSDGTISKYQWTKVSGPAGGSIAAPATAETAVNALQKGTYIFRLTVTDNDGDVDSDDVQVKVNDAPLPPANQLPKANAGPNQNISLPLNTVALKGTGTDTDGAVVSYSWTKFSGPAGGGGAIQTPGAAQTTITGLLQGTYIFRLKVTDDRGGTATDDVQIKVNPPLSASNRPPVADAGADKAIVLPTDFVTLDGSGSHDPDGSISVWSWIKLSGPAKGLLAGGNTAKLSLSELEAGEYVFQLTVTDNRGSSVSDEATVKVSGNTGPNTTPVIKTADSVFVRLPVQNTELDASASFDPDGTVASAKWQYVKGPRSPQILSPESLKTIVAGLIPGTYLFNLTITDNSGGTSQKNVYIIVKNNTARRLIPNIGFFPNPAENKLTLTVDAEIDGRTQVTFYDITGRPVLTAALIKNSRELIHTFNISGLSKGMYAVEIVIERAEKVVRKIIKQ